MNTPNPTDEPILVTGASGYLGSWVVAGLLRRGLTVHATVRNTNDDVKLRHLESLGEEHPRRLRLFEANLLDAGSFDAAMQGCTRVIHTASPYLFERPKDPARELLEPALEGTKNVLSSIERAASVRHLTLTSSIVAMYDSARRLQARPDACLHAEDVNEDSTMCTNPYAYAKTQAEQWAWKKRRTQQRWGMTSIHPGAIFGPSMSRRTDSTSINMMRGFINGSFRRGVPELWLGVVDVRDVAEAHVRASFAEEDERRFIVVAQSIRLLEIAQLVDTDRFGFQENLPRSEAPKWLLWLVGPLAGLGRRYVADNVGFPITFDASACRGELAMTLIPPVQTVNDHIAQLVADGLT